MFEKEQVWLVLESGRSGLKSSVGLTFTNPVAFLKHVVRRREDELKEFQNRKAQSSDYYYLDELIESYQTDIGYLEEARFYPDELFVHETNNANRHMRRIGIDELVQLYKQFNQD